MTEAGRAAAAAAAVPVAPAWLGQVRQALRAHLFFQRGEGYLVQDGKVVVLDAATGRACPGRRFSEGLHQALEAKEQVDIRPEVEPLAQISIQDYFRKYRKLAGVTGTALRQAELLREIYGLQVAVVPTRRPINRIDYEDRVYRTDAERNQGLLADIRHHALDLGRPVLVGVTTLTASEELARLVRERLGLQVNVLNASSRAREADIVGLAGSRQVTAGCPAGMVTIATGAVGRGTEIRVAPEAICALCRVPDKALLDRWGVESDHLLPGGSVKCCMGCPEHDPATRGTAGNGLTRQSGVGGGPGDLRPGVPG